VLRTPHTKNFLRAIHQYLRIGDGVLRMRLRNFGFHKMRPISWASEDMLDSQKGLCSVELFSCLQRFASVCYLSIQGSLFDYSEYEKSRSRLLQKLRQEAPPRCWYVCTILHGFMSQTNASYPRNCRTYISLPLPLSDSLSWQYARSHAPAEV
jgi:hypothetical protein